MIPISTASEIARAERLYAAEGGSLRTLMERAGGALAARAAELCPGGRAAVLCGRGNNGGDGFAAAAALKRRGVPAVCFGEAFGEDPEYFRAAFREEGGEVRPLADAKDLSGFDVVIDALFGTGLNRPPEGDEAAAIRAANGSGLPILSADVPSGVRADGGAFEPRIRASETLTFIRRKPAQFLEESEADFGRVRFCGLDVSAADVPEPSFFAMDAETALRALPERVPVSHKGCYPKVLLLVGATGYSGAAVLAVRAALRAGAGLVFAGVPQSVWPVVAAAAPEAVTFPLPEENGALCPAALREILRRSEGVDAVLCGCGLSRAPGVRETVCGLIEQCERPLVLDADGINALAGHIDVLKKARHTPILTPHPGELARLLGEAPVRPGESAPEAARRIAASLGAVLVMKGHRTLTAGPDGMLFCNTTGNAGMARGGSGDVLAGMLTVLTAKDRSAQAAAAAVWLHGRAGDIAAERKGQTAMLPGDMIDAFPEAFERK